MSSDSKLIRAMAGFLISAGSEKVRYGKEIRKMLAAPAPPKFSGNAQEDAERVLLEIGAPVKLVGFIYCAEAIAMLVENPCGIPKAMSLYKQIGNKHHVSAESVSGSIYNLVNAVFERGSIEVLVKYFGNAIDPNNGKVTPNEFINRLAAYIRNHT